MPEAEAQLRRWYDSESGQPDTYITALPFLPAPSTPVKEQNSGSIYRSSPSHGLVRVEVEGVGDICVGDSVEYQGGAHGGMRCGRVIGLMLSEEVGGLAAQLRQLLTSAEVLDICPQWSDNVPDWEGLWETSWEVTVGIHKIVSLVPVFSEGEGRSVLLGTINDYGDCAHPYKSLASWEEPWRAEGGHRAKAVDSLLAGVRKGLPVITLSLTEWWDGFTTFRHGQVSVTMIYYLQNFNIRMSRSSYDLIESSYGHTSFRKCSNGGLS